MLDLHSVESAKIAVDILRHLLRRSNNFTSKIQVWLKLVILLTPVEQKYKNPTKAQISFQDVRK